MPDSASDEIPGPDQNQSRPAKSKAAREPISPGRSFKGIQTSRTPEYLVIGHICADLRDDGSVVLGGTALYSAITAARLGWRTGVLTRGVYGRSVKGYEIPSLDQFADEIDIIVQESDTISMFVNKYFGGRRTQELPAWAGPIDLRGLPAHWRNARIIHLGPVCQEIETHQIQGLTTSFLGATPQGWMRTWPKARGGRVRTTHLRLPPNLVSTIDGMVVSDEEISDCRDTIDAVGNRRLAAITMGDNGSRVIFGGQRDVVPAYKVDAVDLTGAGDTYATAFFTKATDRKVSAVSAAQYASAVSALSLTGVGVAGIPTAAEVDQFLKTAETYPIRR
jgi:pfkB family carbohydrate kinase